MIDGNFPDKFDQVEQLLKDGARPNYKPLSITTFGKAIQNANIEALKLFGIYGADESKLTSSEIDTLHKLIDENIELAGAFAHIS